MPIGIRQGRTSRGVSGALYLQPAAAGMNPGPRIPFVLQLLVSGDEEPVPRNAVL